MDARLYVSMCTTFDYIVSLIHMLGLIMTMFVKILDYDDPDGHKAPPSKMDILDILPMLGAQSITSIASQGEFTDAMDIDSNTKVGPSNTPHQQTTLQQGFSNVVWALPIGLYIWDVGQDNLPETQWRKKCKYGEEK